MDNQSLIPTMPDHVRTCPEQHCISWTHVLSTQDVPAGAKDGYPIFRHITKWKCEKGHRTDTERLVDMDGRGL